MLTDFLLFSGTISYVAGVIFNSSICICDFFSCFLQILVYTCFFKVCLKHSQFDYFCLRIRLFHYSKKSCVITIVVVEVLVFQDPMAKYRFLKIDPLEIHTCQRFLAEPKSTEKTYFFSIAQQISVPVLKDETRGGQMK